MNEVTWESTSSEKKREQSPKYQHVSGQLGIDIKRNALKTTITTKHSSLHPAKKIREIERTRRNWCLLRHRKRRVSRRKNHKSDVAHW